MIPFYIGRGYSQIQYLDIKRMSQIQYLDIKSTSQILYLDITHYRGEEVKINYNVLNTFISAFICMCYVFSVIGIYEVFN